VEVIGVAPLGDPLELLVRGGSLSIRRTEAEGVSVQAEEVSSAQRAGSSRDEGKGLSQRGFARSAP
jgi:hypothetical protein